MTPDELKVYVDSALQQRDSFTLVYVVAAHVLAIVTAFLYSYASEKAKNAATKEDIGVITTKIQASTAHFTERLEQLKADLGSRAHYGKVRYEREINVFEAVWPKLCELRVAVLSLRPVLDSGLKKGETAESRKTERATQYVDAYNALATTVEHSRPFYPPSIWSELQKLLKLSWDEAVDFRFADDSHEGKVAYWEKAIANATAINEQVDRTCEAIRSRLTAFDEA